MPNDNSTPGKCLDYLVTHDDENYRLLVENQSDLVVKVDPAGHLLYVSPSYCHTFGKTQAELIGTSFMPLVHEEDRLPTSQTMETLWRPPHSAYLEQRCLTPTGWRWFAWQDTAVLDQQGQVTAIIGVGRDISDRRAAEDALMASEKKFRTLFETMQEAFAIHEIICDGTGTPVDYRYLDVNPAFERLTGLSRDTTIGRTVRQVLPEIEPEWIEVFGRVALTGEPAERENYVKDLDRFYRAKAYSPERGRFVAIFEDITEQKRAEIRLTLSERKFRTLFESSADACLIIRGEEFFDCNRAAVESLGAASKADVLNTKPWDISPELQPDGRRSDEKAIELISRTRTTGSTRFEWLHRRMDGSDLPVEVTLTLLPDEDGLYVVWRDITERKQAERILLESEERFKALSEASFGGIIIHDKGLILECNQGLSDITGFSYEEHIGMDGLSLIAPESLDTVLANIRSGYDQSYEVTGVRKDGSRYPLAIRGKNVTYRGREVRVIEFRDISERKQAEEALLYSTSLTNAAFESTADGILIVDRSGTIARWNQKFIDLWHIPEELLKVPFDDAPVLHHVVAQVEHQDEFVAKVTMLYENPEESSVDTLDLIDGRVFERYSQPHRVGHEIVGRFWSFRDITERTRAEQARLHLEKQLLHAQKLESLGVLAGGIAHDFNNILMAIIGNADLALMRVNRESPAVENLHRIEQAAARAADLAKQMLAYSGKGKFVVETIDLNRLLEEMLHMLEVSISKKAVLRLNLHSPLPVVEADATQMRQIVMNLVINASEAIGDKSGVIAITTGCMDCDHRYLKDVWLDENITEGLYVYLEIADSGCGMDQETLSKIFDPFFTTKFTGRGLGMAAVLGIIRGHKGAIKVYSEVGRGSTFKVLLPASGKPPELFNGEPGTHAWQGSGTVLLVDDEETVRAIGSEMLKELGFTTITACDGREALAIFKQTPDISCVILDLTMPHMDGEQCFRELRLLNPDVKVIMSSGYNEQEVTQKFVGKGLAGFVQKPYKLSVLQAAIRNIQD